MKLKIKSKNKRVALDQVFIFNGIRIHIKLLDGDGFADVSGYSVDVRYLEKAILGPLNIEVVHEPIDSSASIVDTTEEVSDKTIEAEESPEPEPKPEPKPEPDKSPKKVEEKVTEKKVEKKTTTRKRTTTRKKRKPVAKK